MKMKNVCFILWKKTTQTFWPSICMGGKKAYNGQPATGRLGMYTPADGGTTVYSVL